MYFQDDSDTVSNDLEGPSTPQRDPSPSDSEEEQIQSGPSRRGRGSTRSRARGRARGRTHGQGQGRGRAQNNQPPEYQWRNVDFSDYFEDDWLETPRQRGILIDTSDYKPVDFFKYFFPDEVFDTMSTHSNLYATQFLENRNNRTYSRYNSWTDTSVKEIQAYVALQIAMGINNRPEIPDYWSTYWLTAGKFNDVMPRNRYQLLNAFLHFNNNDLRIARGEEGYDPLFKVRPLINIIDPRYLSAYAPDKELSIDESMIKFKGRIFFRQYLPAKPTKWGIKTFALCESNTGYGLKFMVYTGKNTFQVDQAAP